MPAIEREPLEEVLRGYDIKVLGVRNESYKDKKGVWWVQTPQGSFILKKLSYSEETLRHILHATRHLTGNGINMPAIIKTKEKIRAIILRKICPKLLESLRGFMLHRRALYLIQSLNRRYILAHGYRIMRNSLRI